MYHVIVNPAASSGEGMSVWEEVKDVFDARNVEYREHILQRKGEAVSLAARLTENPKEDCHLLVLGGDGTLNEVLNGIADFAHTKLSCIRMGSGNDFARNVGLEEDVSEALSHLLDEPEETILDYGIVTTDNFADSRRFIISSGVGYDADICYEVSNGRLKGMLNRIHLGWLSYLLIGIKLIFSSKQAKAKLYLDDRKPVLIRDLFFVVGMIHKMEGGGVPFCPDADPTDGKMDVCLVRNMSKIKKLLAVALVYRRRHTMLKNVSTLRCHRMRLVTQHPQWIHMDGETPYKVNVVEWTCESGLRFVK